MQRRNSRLLPLVIDPREHRGSMDVFPPSQPPPLVGTDVFGTLVGFGVKVNVGTMALVDEGVKVDAALAVAV